MRISRILLSGRHSNWSIARGLIGEHDFAESGFVEWYKKTPPTVHRSLISRILISEEILSIFLNVAYNQNKSIWIYMYKSLGDTLGTSLFALSC